MPLGAGGQGWGYRSHAKSRDIVGKCISENLAVETMLLLGMADSTSLNVGYMMYNDQNGAKIDGISVGVGFKF